MKKLVDLHAHLGGSTSAATLYEIAIRRGMNIKIPVSDSHISNAYYEFADLINGKFDKDIDHEKYLKKFDLVEEIQSTTFSIEQSIRDTLMNAFLRDGVDMMEIRFNPMLRNKSGFYDIDRMIESACTEMKKVTGMFPIKAGIIICTDWRFTKEQSNVLAKKAVKYAGMGVVGFDIAGPYVETMDIREHTDALRNARLGGLGITIHMGEINDHQEMDYIFQNFVPDRVGHGIAAHGSERTMEFMNKHDILAEVCPSSVMKTKAVHGLIELSDILTKFDEHNVPYSLNTDGKILLQTTIMGEYQMLKPMMGWYDRDIERINNRARKYNFIEGNHRN